MVIVRPLAIALGFSSLHSLLYRAAPSQLLMKSMQWLEQVFHYSVEHILMKASANRGIELKQHRRQVKPDHTLGCR